MIGEVKQFRNILFAVLRTLIAIGLIIYLSTSGAIEWPSILHLVVNWPRSLLALFLLFLALVIQAERLCILLRPHDMFLSLASSVKLTLMGTFFNFCLPGATGGDAIKIYYALEGNKGRRTELATLMLFDRAVGMFGLLVLPLLISLIFFEFHRLNSHFLALLLIAASIAILMLIGVLVCFMTKLKNSHLLNKTLESLPLGTYARRIFDAIHSYRQNLDALAKAIGITILCHILTVTAMVSLVKAFGSTGPYHMICLLVPLGLVANSLPVTPGGLGVGEAVFDKLFSMTGLVGGAELLIGWRILMILLGLIGLRFYLQGRKRFVHIAVSSGFPLERLT